MGTIHVIEMGLNGFLLFCLVLGVIERGYAAALQGGGGYSYDASAPRSCEASLNGEPNPLQGTCTSLDDCEKYLALPPYPGRKSPCSKYPGPPQYELKAYHIRY